MKRFATTCGIGALSLGAAPASADGTATWIWEVTTPNGDNIVDPGESAFIKLAFQMDPDPGDELIGMAATIHDTISELNGERGEIVDWEVLNFLSSLTGDLTTTDGVNLFFTNAGQLTAFGGVFIDDNPIDVLSFEWEPEPTEEAFLVRYATETEAAVVWEDIGGEDVAVDYPVTEAEIKFFVNDIPAPASALPLAALPVLARRRR